MTGATTVDEGYDELDEEAGLSGFWILVIFLAVLAVFAGIVAIAYQKGAHSTGGDLPSVGADPNPIRTEIGHEPVGEGRAEVDEELNRTAPARVVAAIEPETDPLAGYETEDAAPIAQALETNSVPATVPDRSQLTPDPATAATTPPQQAAVGAPSAPSVNPASTRRPAASSPQPTPAATSPQPTPVVANATHSVQVGAFGSRDEAMEFYGSLMKRMGPLVGDQRPEVRVATVKGREYHRLWIGAFSDKGSASTYCAQLKAKGQDCLVRAR